MKSANNVRSRVIFDLDAAKHIPGMSAMPPKAEVKSGYRHPFTTGRSGLMMSPGA
jgi:hypothetical protein